VGQPDDWNTWVILVPTGLTYLFMANDAKYTVNDSRLRLTLYIIIAATPVVASEVRNSNWANYTWQQAVISLCSLIVSIATAWRAYIDQTDGQVVNRPDPKSDTVSK